MPLSLLAACYNHGMEAVLNPREHFRLPSENCHNLGVCLLDEADMTGQKLSPCGQPCPVVRRSEEGDSPGRLKDVPEVFLGPLSRCHQGLSRSLTHTIKVRGVPYIFTNKPSQAMANENGRSLVLRLSV
jgi:hypothetical protein